MEFKDIKSGAKVRAPNIQLGTLIGRIGTSNTKIEVQDDFKGLGWSEKHQRYMGKKKKNGWFRGENLDYGTIHPYHRKDVELIQEEE